MDSPVYDKLKGKGLADERVKIVDHKGEEREMSLLDYVVDLDEGVTKTRLANKDLTTQRETWETEKKEFKTNLKTLTEKKVELEGQIEELSGKTNKKSKESEELLRQFNAVSEEIKQLKADNAAAKEEARIAKETSRADRLRSAEETLKSDIITELGKQKITGAQAEAAFAVIKTKGSARVEEDSEGKSYKRIFVNIKDGKELASDIKNMCENFAKENQFFVSASGNSGTGGSHDSNRPVNGNTNGKEPSALDMLRMTDK